jgi:WD40 repeat protein
LPPSIPRIRAAHALNKVLGYFLQSSQILCLDLHPTKDNLALTGGADNKVVLLDRSSGKAVATMSGHTKKITRVLFHPTEDVAFSASSDKTVKIWNSATGAATHTLKEHTADVTGITVHATGEFLVTASSDKSWAFYDIATGTCRAHVKDPNVLAGYRSPRPARAAGAKGARSCRGMMAAVCALRPGVLYRPDARELWELL